MMENYRIFKIVCLLTFAVLSTAQPPEPITTQYNRINCNGRIAVCVGPLSYLSCQSDVNGNYRSVGEVSACAPGTRCVNDGLDICVPFRLITSSSTTDIPVNTFGLISQNGSDPLHKVSTEGPSSRSTIALTELPTTTESESIDHTQYTTSRSDITFTEETTTDEVSTTSEYIGVSYADTTTDFESYNFEVPTEPNFESSSNYDSLVAVVNDLNLNIVPAVSQNTSNSVGGIPFANRTILVESTIKVVPTFPLYPLTSIDAADPVDNGHTIDSSGNIAIAEKSSSSVDVRLSVDSIGNNVPNVQYRQTSGNAKTNVESKNTIDSSVKLGLPVEPSTSVDINVPVNSIGNIVPTALLKSPTAVNASNSLDSASSVDSSVNVGIPDKSSSSVDVRVPVDSIGNNVSAVQHRPISGNAETNVESAITIDSTLKLGLPLEPSTSVDVKVPVNSIGNTVPTVPLKSPTAVNAANSLDSASSVDSSINRDVILTINPSFSVDVIVPVNSIGNTVPLKSPTAVNTANSLDSASSVDSSVNVGITDKSVDVRVPEDSIGKNIPALQYRPISGNAEANFESAITIDSSVKLGLPVKRKLGNTLSAKPWNKPILSDAVGPVDSGNSMNSSEHRDVGIVVKPLTSSDAAVLIDFMRSTVPAVSKSGDSSQLLSNEDTSFATDEITNQSEEKDSQNLSNTSNISKNSEETSNVLSNESRNKRSGRTENESQDNNSESNESTSKTDKRALKSILNSLRDFDCKTDDVVPDPSHFNKYFRCIKNKSNRIKMEHLHCDDGYFFDAVKLKCKYHGK